VADNKENKNNKDNKNNKNIAYDNKRNSRKDTDKNSYTGYKPKDKTNKADLNNHDSIDKNSEAS
jgi:hypothetical protein